MTMDTPSGDSGALDTVQAASELAKLLDPQPQQNPSEEPAATEPEKDGDKPADEPVTQEDAPAEPAKFTVKVDGKDVELTEAEIADAYKNGLRQADYTRKTMEAADQRKAAEAEASKAREERTKYANGLQQAQSLLQAQLQEQSQIDWQRLLETDPVEYMKQDRIARERQARLQQIHSEQQHLYAVHLEEQAKAMRSHVQQQQDELLAKLPDWKDPAKAKAEKSAIKDYLKSQGLEDAQIDNITDHRVVILARNAMRYEQMMDKAKAASKRVDNLPKIVERPGGGESNALDGRTKAMNALKKSGRVEDAAAIFAQLL